MGGEHALDEGVPDAVGERGVLLRAAAHGEHLLRVEHEEDVPRHVGGEAQKHPAHALSDPDLSRASDVCYDRFHGVRGNRRRVP